MGMHAATRNQWALPFVILLLAAATASAEASLDDAHAAGRTGAGVRVATVGDAAPALADATRLVAPDADARAFGGAASAGAALVEALAWGARVVVVDAPGADDALVAQLEGAAASGVIVVIPAGDGALHHWGGAWLDADADGLLDVAPSDDAMLVTLEAGETLEPTLTWESAASTDDFDLYLYDEALKTPLAWSTAFQRDGAPAREWLSFVAPDDMRAQLVVRRYDASGDATLRLTIPTHLAPLEHATPVGALESAATARGVVVAGTREASSALGPTPDGRAVDVWFGPAGLGELTGTRAAAAYAAGTLALLLGELPDASLDALATLARDEAGAVDPARAVMATDVAPAALSGAVASPTGVVQRGNVSIALAFDDALDTRATPAPTVFLVDAAGARHAVAGGFLDARTWSGSRLLDATVADGALSVRIEGAVEWNGRALGPLEAPLALTLDTTAPKVALSPIPTITNAAVPLSWRATDARLAGVAVEVASEGAWATLDADAPAEGRIAFAPLHDGAYRFRVTATDAAGNMASATSAHEVVIDRTPPTIARVGDLAATIFDERALDTTGTLVLLDARPHAATDFDAATGSLVIHADLAPGAHRVLVLARDAAGNGARIGWTFEVAPLLAVASATDAAPEDDAAPLTEAPTVARDPADDPPPPEPAPLERTSEAPPASAAASAPRVGAGPEYDWQPPVMVLFFTLAAAVLLYPARHRLRRGARDVRIFFEHAWARVVRLRFRLTDARGWPRRAMLRVEAFAHRARWRLAQRRR